MSAKRVAWPWAELGLKGRSTLREVKQAYAARLRAIDREDPAAFQALSQAFAAAKKAAKPEPAAPQTSPDDATATTARPSMTALATGRPDTAPFIPVTPPPPASMPQRETIAKAPAHDSEPPLAPEPKPEITPAPELAPELASEPDQTAPTPKPAPTPWANPKTAPLDTLFDTDPGAAELEFWRRLSAATVPNIQTAALDTLLALDFAREPWVRKEAEKTIYRAIVADLRSLSFGMPRDLALWLEVTFGWASDGVGMQKRLGRGQDMQVVIHALSLGMPKTAATTQTAKPFNMFKVYGIALGLPLGVALVSAKETVTEETLFISIFTVWVIFAAIYIALYILLPLLWRVLVLLRLEVHVMNTLQKHAPRFARRLDLNPKLWELPPLILASTLTSVAMLMVNLGSS